jgi:hypothetical protein
MTSRNIAILFLLMLLVTPQAYGGDTYALVVNGLNKDPEEKLEKDRAVKRLREYLLTVAKVHPDRLTVLDAGDANVPSTRDNFAVALDALATTVSRSDRLLFFYLGQANAVTGTLRLNLPGPDVTHEELAGSLSQIRADTQLIVLDCPCAGLAAKDLPGPGRIVVCATTETEAYSPRFGRYFVRALTQVENDTDANEKVSVLEAFTAAARQIEQWYRDRAVLPTETPCLEDNGDGIPSEQPWRYTVEPVDGSAASECYLAEN